MCREFIACYPERCLVAPHPELQKRLQKDLTRLRRRRDAALTGRITFARRKPVGMDDGLIYPGDHYPLGTSAAAVRAGALRRAPLTGSLRVIVVLVDFSDKHMAKTKKHFEDLFFSTGVLPNGSVRDYFREVSHGLVDIVGEVAGPFRLPKKLSEYAHGDSGTGSVEPNARTMARDAAVAANPAVNFASFDNDGDGFVDAFIVIHAGPGGEVTGDSGDIWSHKWVLSGGSYNADGTKIYSYLTVPEDCKIGVCCHELGHLLFGWPDLYDTDYSSSGLGNWCLMAGGSWNGGGDVPAHPSAWCKANQGWVSVVTQTTNQTVSIADVKTSHKVYRLWKDGAAGSEYFLVENRQKVLYDRLLPGDGLLIYHIDEAIGGNSDESHPRVALAQADGDKELEAGTNRGDDGDPFPGSENNTTFNKSSTPDSKSYGGMDTCVGVTSIGPSGATISARLSVKCKVKEGKEFKEIKEVKEHFKDAKDFFKEHHKEWIPEKKPEKPITDKSAGLDKPWDKAGEKPGEGGWGLASGVEAPAAAGSLEARVLAIEGVLRSLQPFIASDLRPDLSTGALLREEDREELHARMKEGSAGAKRHYDAKPGEA